MKKKKTGLQQFKLHFTDEKNKLEWAVFFFGLALLLAVIAFLSVQWFRNSQDEVKLSVSWWLDPKSNHYELILLNEGNKTVSSVHIRALCWHAGPERPEEVPIIIDMSPRHSESKAWFQFPHPPGEEDSISVHIAGYQ